MAGVVAIIGNGFDLNLGMPTKYQDFLRSPYFPVLKDEDSGSLAWALRIKADAQGWVDIEQELAAYSIKNGGTATFKEEYYALRKALSQYLNSLPLPSNSSSTHAHKLIQEVASKAELKIVNFNYTSSVKHLLRVMGLDEDAIKGIHHSIHGIADDESIIFGVDDGSVVPEQHEFLYKSSAPNFLGIKVLEHLQSAHEIHFFGHSLGQPDHMYFRNYFGWLLSGNCPWTLNFYYYGEQGRLGLLSQLRLLTNGNVGQLRTNVNILMIDVAEPLSD